MASEQPAKDISAELDYQARHAAAASPIEKNSPEKIARYRDCKNHRSVRKEYTFRLIHQLKPATVLDFGCGDGEVCVQLTLLGYQTTGFDVSPEYIQLAQERARVDGVEGKAKFFVADASNVTIEAQTFDLVLVQLVLHHVDLRPCLSKTSANTSSPADASSSSNLSPIPRLSAGSEIAHLLKKTSAQTSASLPTLILKSSANTSPSAHANTFAFLGAWTASFPASSLHFSFNWMPCSLPSPA